MPRQILSYGEDPLTLWALQSRLDRVLAQLGDSTEPAKALVIYRPSFGRGGRSRSSSKPSASFGEFDAIVATGESVYAVEAKWDGSPEFSGDELVIRPGQILRHQIFGWYRRTWLLERPATWEEFDRGFAASFELEFPNNRLAPAGSRLAANLEFVLRALDDHSPVTRDVALYCSSTTASGGPPTRCVPDSFRLVRLEYDPVSSDALYFELSSGSD